MFVCSKFMNSNLSQVYEGGNNLGRRASLCETVLGLVPGRFSEPPDSRVMVAGLVPGSHALRNGAIKIGELHEETVKKVLEIRCMSAVV